MQILIGFVCLVYDLAYTPLAWAAKPVSEDPHAGLPQNWDQTLSAGTRFDPNYNGWIQNLDNAIRTQFIAIGT